ncbi:MAG: CheR family methyltransferase [Nitrospiria bacterium]
MIDLPEDIFRHLRDMLNDHCGVYFEDESRYFVEGRLQNSLRRLQIDNFKDYYFFIKYNDRDQDEFSRLIDLLTIHETYFFREDQQLKAFSDEILPEVLATRAADKSLRIWSAGCSTGEEAYTISMLILENDVFKDWNIEIFAADISQRVLQSARRGIYSNSSLRVIDPFYLSKYFPKEEQGFRIDDRVKKRVTFLHLNLLDSDKMGLIHGLDVIFCRNVIIYFDHQAKKKIITTFFQKLNRGGFLMLGHSESLINLSTAFSLRHFRHDMVYQKHGDVNAVEKYRREAN